MSELIEEEKMTFEKFRAIIRDGEKKGEIKTSAPLTDFDLAVQWVVGQIGEERGYPCCITPDEIFQRLPQEFKEQDQE